MGALIIDLAGPELSHAEYNFLAHPHVAGVVLFTRNYRTPEQLSGLCRELRAARDGLLIMVDQEGGTVQRFYSGFSRLPPAAAFGACYDRDPEAALCLAADTAWLMAWELGLAGLDLSLAPVLDLAGPDLAIGERAFHRDPRTTSRLGIAWMRGARHAGMASVGKHYPGLGMAAGDTHVQTCVDSRPQEQLLETDLLPFREAMAAGIEGLMAAHVRYPNIADRPASLAGAWLRLRLREQQGYRGLVLSDDLGMAAAAHFQPDPAARVRAAWKAGCDLALICNLGTALPHLLDTLAADPVTIPDCAPLRRQAGAKQPDADAIRARLTQLTT